MKDEKHPNQQILTFSVPNLFKKVGRASRDGRGKPARPFCCLSNILSYSKSATKQVPLFSRRSKVEENLWRKTGELVIGPPSGLFLASELLRNVSFLHLGVTESVLHQTASHQFFFPFLHVIGRFSRLPHLPVVFDPSLSLPYVQKWQRR